jgi:hypothetical protein
MTSATENVLPFRVLASVAGGKDERGETQLVSVLPEKLERFCPTCGHDENFIPAAMIDTPWVNYEAWWGVCLGCETVKTVLIAKEKEAA